MQNLVKLKWCAENCFGSIDKLKITKTSLKGSSVHLFGMYPHCQKYKKLVSS